MKTFFTQAILLASSGFASTLEECYMPIDVMFLQDSTGSFEDDLPNVRESLCSKKAAGCSSNTEYGEADS